MARIERSRQGLLKDASATKARIKKIDRLFSLMALVEQKGDHVVLHKLDECMTALDVKKAGGETVVDVLQSTGSTLRGKMNILHPLLRREHRQLRKSLQIAERNARVLRKIARRYFYSPGTPEV